MAEVFQVKAIKAKKLQYAAVQREILKELRGEAKDVEAELDKTVATWDKAPKFESIIDIDRKGNISILTGPIGDAELVQIWNWLDEGTKPHIIVPKQPGVYPLRFIWDGPGSYKAKTEPKMIGSTAGGATGDVVFFHKVKHPGTEPRLWSLTVQQRRRKRYTRRMIKATQRGLERAKR